MGPTNAGHSPPPKTAQIDDDFRPWLIEVNTNPYLGIQNAWHKRLVYDMVEDMVSLAVDPRFPNPNPQAPSTSPSANRSRKNRFKLIHSEAADWTPPVSESVLVKEGSCCFETHCGACPGAQ